MDKHLMKIFYYQWKRNMRLFRRYNNRQFYDINFLVPVVAPAMKLHNLFVLPANYVYS